MRIPALRLVGSLTALAVPVLAVAAVLCTSARDAQAKPEFSKKEGKDCAYCHVNPKGGGARNEKGIEYQRNGFKFSAEGKGFGEDKAFKNEANAKVFEYVRAAIQLEHFSYALKRVAELRTKEPPKGSANAKLSAVESTIDGKGRDLVKAAQEDVQGGKAAEAAVAVVRVEVEFRGRDVAKSVAKWRGEVAKLSGGKDALTKAAAEEPARIALLDAKMKAIEGDNAAAIKILEDLIAKAPEGSVTPEAKTKLDELKKSAEGGAAMGG
jgi:hypothetical protein